MKRQAKKLFQRIKSSWMNMLYFSKNIPWIHVLIILFCTTVSGAVLYFLVSNNFKSLDTEATLSNLLTVNAVFSAILITYLFTRVTWLKDKKSNILREAENISMKITEFRRILNTLTENFGIWNNERATKSLLDTGDFKHVDFFDFQMLKTSDYIPENEKLIRKLYEHSDYSESHTSLYLAMVSLVKDRNIKRYVRLSELYKDFETRIIYNIKYVEKWAECGIFGIIWHWFNRDNDYINYLALRNQKDYIISAAARINKKYKNYDLDNRLMEELADDFSVQYLKELYLLLKKLKKGITDLNFVIITLISISLIFGVLSPFILTLVSSQSIWYLWSVSILASVNAGLISYFIIRFPFMIHRELKWI